MEDGARKIPEPRRMYFSGIFPVCCAYSAVWNPNCVHTIQVAQAEKIEIINNLVEGFRSESSKIKSQSKKVQSVVYKYLEAYIRAIAGFGVCSPQRFYRPDSILNSIPEETDVLSFVYHGRNLTIRTIQPQQECVLEMVEHLEQRAENDGEFSDVVASYYLDGEGAVYCRDYLGGTSL